MGELIFQRGASAKDSREFEFNDETGLLEWLAKDRAVVKFRNMHEAESSERVLAAVVNQWMMATSD